VKASVTAARREPPKARRTAPKGRKAAPAAPALPGGLAALGAALSGARQVAYWNEDAELAFNLVEIEHDASLVHAEPEKTCHPYHLACSAMAAAGRLVSAMDEAIGAPLAGDSDENTVAVRASLASVRQMAAAIVAMIDAVEREETAANPRGPVITPACSP
jgi:hypothetical protein